MILGLGRVVYKVSDLDQAKAWHQGVFGVEPILMSRSVSGSTSRFASWVSI